MALATNSTPGSIVLAGDLTGTANTPELRVTGVTPGSYIAPDIVVDSKGRVLSASEPTTFVGDMIGTRPATVLKASGVTAGSYTNASPTINSQGLVTSITGSGLTLGGHLTGDIGSNVLAPTGITPGVYAYPALEVDSAGRVVNIEVITPAGYDISSYTVNGIAQIDQSLGLTVASGDLSGTLATSTVYGVAKSNNSSNINITTGTVNVGSGIPTTSTTSTFTKSVNITQKTVTTPSAVLDLDDGVLFNLTSTSAINISTINGATGSQFDIKLPNNYLFWAAVDANTPNTSIGDYTNGKYITTGGTSTDCASWSPLTTPTYFTGWIDDPLYTCGVYVWLCSSFQSGIPSYDNYVSAVSADGISWSSGVGTGITSFRLSYTRLAGSGTLAMRIGQWHDGSYSGTQKMVGVVQTSTDGANWTVVNADAPWGLLGYNEITYPMIQDVLWTGSTFLATTGQRVYSSVDGVSWTQVFNHGSASDTRLILIDSFVVAVFVNGYTHTIYRCSLTGGSWVLQKSSSSGRLYTPRGYGGALVATIQYGNSTDDAVVISRDLGQNLIVVPSPYYGTDGSSEDMVNIVAAGHAGVLTTKLAGVAYRCVGTYLPSTTWSGFKFDSSTPSATLQCTHSNGINYCTYQN